MSSERSGPTSDTDAPPQLSQVSETAPPGVFPVVAVGAGDVQTIQQFFAAMSPGDDLGFLVVPGPGPVPSSGEDIAASLRATAPLPVRAADPAARLAPNQIVVVPPADRLEAIDASLTLTLTPSERTGNVDAGLRAVAQALGPWAIGVLLGGDGTNGTLGLAEIRRLGGLAAVQSLQDWTGATVPAAALTTTPVDSVLPLAELAQHVRHYGRELVRHSAVYGAASAAGPAPEVLAAIARIVRAIYEFTHQDFHIYRPAHLLPAVTRRQLLLGFAGLDEYARHVEQNAKESFLLQRDLLAGPRQFFRLPAGMDALQQHVIPPLFYDRNGSDQVRVWIGGCATGEEAYSIAILLQEHMDHLADPPELRIFATDPDLESLRLAREGMFVETAAAEISPGRLHRFFVRDGRWLRISQAVRKQIIFAQHNPFKDPPFPKLDLVVSRDFLAALTPEAQARLAALWHVALKPGGCLFVGPQDAPDSGLFSPLAPALPIYRRLAMTDVSRPAPPEAGLEGGPGTGPGAASDYRERTIADVFAEQVHQYMPPGLLVDQSYDIVYYSDGISAFLVQPGGPANDSLLARVHPDLREHVATAVLAALKQGTTTQTDPIGFGHDGQRQYTRVVVQPVERQDVPRLALVLFMPVAVAETAGVPDMPPVPQGLVRRLRYEMDQLQQRLHLVTDEYSTINDELKAANEELVSLNEELQLKAVELQRGKEELQAANQELLVINQENQGNIAELRRISANLQNLIVAADIATLFLNEELDIRWFTPAVSRLFNLMPGDEGRPLWHITHRLAYGDLEQAARRVLATLDPYETEVGSETGAWYFMRVLPYRTTEQRVDGLVVTFIDITARKQAEDALRRLNQQLEQRVEERTRELARSNRELDQFAYVASHDLKAPLRAVTNLANWISEDAAKALPEASQQHLEKLRVRIGRMERLLDDLLAYSRAGRHLHKPEWLDAADLVRSIQFFLALPPGFSFELEHPMPRLFAERVPLETVLRNLVGNAVKHHDRPDAGFVRVAAVDRGDWVEFSVADNGPGIAPQNQDRIFQIFQTLKPRDQVEGSGMGLAVVKKTVESQGGRIELTSDVGQGAVLRFTWPKLADDRTEA